MDQNIPTTPIEEFKTLSYSRDNSNLDFITMKYEQSLEFLKEQHELIKNYKKVRHDSNESLKDRMRNILPKIHMHMLEARQCVESDYQWRVFSHYIDSMENTQKENVETLSDSIKNLSSNVRYGFQIPAGLTSWDESEYTEDKSQENKKRKRTETPTVVIIPTVLDYTEMECHLWNFGEERTNEISQ